jgi:hypothetical protein
METWAKEGRLDVDGEIRILVRNYEKILLTCMPVK